MKMTENSWLCMHTLCLTLDLPVISSIYMICFDTEVTAECEKINETGTVTPTGLQQ